MTPLRSRILWLVPLLAVAWPVLAQGPKWSPVPGAEEVLLDLSSVQFRGATVRAWVKNLPGPLPLRHRTAVLTQFDCQGRTLQVMGTIGYDAAGKPLTSASLPGRPQPVPGDEATGWLYDALCEGARSIP